MYFGLAHNPEFWFLSSSALVSDFDLNALSRELETDVHTASIEDLCRRFNTTTDMGKTR